MNQILYMKIVMIIAFYFYLFSYYIVSFVFNFYFDLIASTCLYWYATIFQCIHTHWLQIQNALPLPFRVQILRQKTPPALQQRYSLIPEYQATVTPSLIRTNSTKSTCVWCCRPFLERTPCIRQIFHRQLQMWG